MRTMEGRLLVEHLMTLPMDEADSQVEMHPDLKRGLASRREWEHLPSRKALKATPGWDQMSPEQQQALWDQKVAESKQRAASQ